MNRSSIDTLAAHYASALIDEGLTERQFNEFDTDVLTKLIGVISQNRVMNGLILQSF
jgi:hypothetical protein